MRLITFDHVSKIYRGQEKKVIDDISFTVEQGEIAVFIGPSGCGKTTCLKMINRLIPISSGSITVGGQDVSQADPIELRRKMGYVIQQTGLFPHMTVRQNIEIIPRLEKQDPSRIEKKTESLMQMVGLDPAEYMDRYPTQLSGGQLQRVGVARAFATDPEVILMDEPFSALDPITRRQLQDELLFLQAQLKKTIVLVTHDMDQAIRLAHHIGIINHGRLVQYDTPERIMKEPADAYVAQFVGPNRIWSNPEYIRARDIMIADPVVAPLGLSAIKTMEIMRTYKVDSALVLDPDDHLMGVARALDIQNAPDKSVSNETLLRQPKATAAPEDNIIELLTRIRKAGTGALPIVDGDGRLQGLVTNSSLVTAMSQQYIPIAGEEAQQA